MGTIGIVLAVLCAVIIIMLILILIRLSQGKNANIDVHAVTETVRGLILQSEQSMKANLMDNIRTMGENITGLQRAGANAQSQKLNDVDRQLNQKIGGLKESLEKEVVSIKRDTDIKLTAIQNIVDEKLQRTMDEKMNNFGQMLAANQKQASEAQRTQISEMASKVDLNLNNMNIAISDKQEQSGKAVDSRLKALEERFKTLEAANEQKLENMRKTMSEHLVHMQEENQRKLDSIQSTVNEKLESQLQKSFKLVSEQLETVHKSLGEMQNIASGVGDLKKVLSNVKTRGILGEIQLGSILEEILAPEQYDTEVPTVKGSKERVEFAVKLPGKADGQSVYLPIDSKFPGDTYEQLLNAYDTGNKETIEAAKKNLVTIIKKCAKDIKEKYVSPPDTTNFGIMFLPFEGLYAEVVNLGMIETLQRDYSVNITGPSTMAAMLNSLQMGFKTLAIQKKSSEVWTVLGAVKKEFTTFQTVLDKAQKQIQSAGDSIDKLIGTRTRAINRKLSSVEILDNEDESQKLLGLDMEE